jgi:RNA polymerase sigma-70 factor, ECF subfamily
MPPDRMTTGGAMQHGQTWGGVEERLLERVAAGDVDSFAALYDRYSRAVYSLACGMLANTQIAQEITQEVFEGIWRGAGAFTPGRGTARSWILALAHHKSVDALRRLRVRAAEPLFDTHPGETDVVALALQRVEGAEVRTALGTLSEPQRAVLMLAYYGGYTQHEIAERLRIPLGTVKTRMRDGLQRLRGMLRGAAESRE